MEPAPTAQGIEKETMRIHIVTETETQSWILRPWSETLARELPNARVGCTPNPDADANFFINYALYQPVSTLALAMFTHRERDSRGEVFDRVAREVDWCFAQSQNTASILPPGKTSVLPTGLTNVAFYKAPLVLGVVGRDYPSGRKRMSWVKDLRAIKGVEVRRPHSIPSVDMPAFYDGLDYLVVLADNEGGPQPVLEALARCKPIIAPNVGYCWEYPVLRYSTKEELLNIIQRLVLSQDIWKRAAQTVLEVLRRL